MPVNCPYCDREFRGPKLNARHLAKCNPEGSPKVPSCLCGHESSSLTQMKRHRRVCSVWQGRDKVVVAESRRRQTAQVRYGVDNARQSPEANAKRKATCKARYGAENPFCRGASTFDKVQALAAENRPVLKGADNPFAWSGVQEKIRDHWQREHGVDNPQQVPEIRAQTRATVVERYGGELRGSPILRERIDQTNMERYGSAEPSRHLDVKAHIRATNMERFGVPWTSMDPAIRQKQVDTMIERWGSHFFASEEGKEILRGILMDKYGVEFPSQIDGHRDRVEATCLERYGVTHPMQLEEFREKARQTCIARYGTPFPGLMTQGMNKLEAKVSTFCSDLLFTGDGAFWKKLPLLGRYKNPYFIMPGPVPDHPHRGVQRVVEVFGDFWHSRIFTGKAPFEHEQELIDAYEGIGIACLVVWESDVKQDAEGVAAKVQRFVGGSSVGAEE